MNTSAATLAEHDIPAHVPPELVKVFDFRTGLGDDPHATVGALHQGPPIIYSPVHHNELPNSPGTWIPLRAADIRAVLQDPATFSSDIGRAKSRELTLIPLELDPPEHTKYRALMNPLFSPKKIQALEQTVLDVSTSLIDKILEKGSCDFVEDFARPFPIGIFLGLMGLPQEEMPRFLEWEGLIMRQRSTRAEGIEAVCGYLSGLIKARRLEPTDDLISFAVQSQVDGRVLDDSEALGLCLLLFIGGLDTVASSLGFYMRYLAEHHADQQVLREDPSLIPDAVEEFLRAFAVVNTSREATCDTEIAGVAIKKGDNITCSTILACRDPLEFEAPDVVNIRRNPNPHNAFAYGPHRCIGSHLARRELLIGLRECLSRIPTFSIKEGIPPRVAGGGVFSVESLELVW
ncbi:MAG: cytochrome P450 [Pseudomonas sp.]|uniref:cytochrome P450 n=1 Tax=Pseudomonas sp. TaxID=306 RepID=UPI0039827906